MFADRAGGHAHFAVNRLMKRPAGHLIVAEDDRRREYLLLALGARRERSFEVGVTVADALQPEPQSVEAVRP